MRIGTVRHAGLARLLTRDDRSGVPPALLPRVRRVLTALILAPNPALILGPPGWRVHQLQGDRAGTWSVSVSGNWRITFEVRDGVIERLDLEDYH